MQYNTWCSAAIYAYMYITHQNSSEGLIIFKVIFIFSSAICAGQTGWKCHFPLTHGEQLEAQEDRYMKKNRNYRR